MVKASPVSSAPSLDVASANLRVPCGPSSVRRQAAMEPRAITLPAGLIDSIDASRMPAEKFGEANAQHHARHHYEEIEIDLRQVPPRYPVP